MDTGAGAVTPTPDGRIDPAEEIPGMVFVPMFPLGGHSDARLLVELWGETSPHPYTVGFLTLKDLVSQLGPHQPWALMPVDELRRICLEKDLGGLIIDPLPGTVTPRWTPEKLDELTEVNDGLAASGS